MVMDVVASVSADQVGLAVLSPQNSGDLGMLPSLDGMDYQ